MSKLAARVLAPVAALAVAAPAFAADGSKRVDINTATPEQLKETLGVGDEGAARIIEARPYYKKDDLKAKHVMTADEFDKLQKLIESVC